MRIACLQLNPIIGKIDQNIARANKIINEALTKLDKPFELLILPELAFTGYNYKSRAAITPYLETQTKGISTKWAIETSMKHKCFTVVGYPEKHENTIYNSAVVTSPDGSIIHHYRKTHLYEADEEWGCSENPDKSFPSFQLHDIDHYIKGTSPKYSITTQIGICMDLNPYKFEAPFNKFEFSMSCFINKTKLILCPMSWLSPLSPNINESASGKPQQIKQLNEINYNLINTNSASSLTSANTTDNPENIASNPDISTIDYWILRFLPFVRYPSSKNTALSNYYYYNKVSLVCCNRNGQEDNVLYGGSSSIIQFHSGKSSVATSSHTNDEELYSETGSRNPSVQLLGSLNVAQEGIIIRDVDVEHD